MVQIAKNKTLEYCSKYLMYNLNYLFNCDRVLTHLFDKTMVIIIFLYTLFHILMFSLCISSRKHAQNCSL